MMPRTEKPMPGTFRFFMLVSSVFLILTHSAPVAGALDTTGGSDPSPLRPPDTASPRDTLRSFLTNVDLVVSDAKQGIFNRRTSRAFLSAIATLDLSTTPHRDSHKVRTGRVLLLKEILDRIELPPDNEIPGEAEVAADAVTRWTVPDTSIVIAQVESGPQAGTFLFSADTVEQLYRLYAAVKHLSYKSGGSEGIYEGWLRTVRTGVDSFWEAHNRLRPVDTSNPRSTLEGFLDSVSRAHALVTQANAALTAVPPTMTRDQAREIEATAGNLLSRAAHTFDLSEVPVALREDVGIETALRLKEIIDRLLLPMVESVPNAHMVAATKKAAKELSSGGAEAVRWRYPDSEIEIVEMTEGERKGQFLFSAATVRRISEFYEKIKDLPYRDAPRHFDWIAPDKSEGFYEYYISTPGHLVSRNHPLGLFVDNLPAGLKTFYGEQTVWQWIGLLASILAIALAAYLIYFILKRTAKRVRAPLDGWLMVLAPIAVAITVGVMVAFIDSDLNITGDALNAVTTSGRALVIAMAALGVYLVLKAVAETIITLPQVPDESIDASLLRIGARVVGFLIGAWILIDGIQDLGLNMIPLLAGLGVGGLAVALAAQSTIANFIGSLILYANRPVRVGDFCRYGEDPSAGWLRIGTVEEIGLHSTRLRGIDRTITNIPNAEFSNMHIVNLTARDRMLFKKKVGLRLDTTPDQTRLVRAGLREMLLAHPRVTDDPARVRVSDYGPNSIDVEIFAYVGTADWNDFLAVQEDLVLRIMDIVKEAGTALALPPRILYHRRDNGLDSELEKAAERQVREWGDAHSLPFPDFPEDYREQITDTLDYPPKGSPDYEPRTGLPEPESELHGPSPPEAKRNGPRTGSEFQ